MSQDLNPFDYTVCEKKLERKMYKMSHVTDLDRVTIH